MQTGVDSSIPHGLVVRIRRSHRRGPGLIPGVGTVRTCLIVSVVQWSSRLFYMHVSSGMRNLRTLFDLASDWLMEKWSVLIGREQRPRD